MNIPAFTTSFTGLRIRTSSTSPITTPRCAMGDSIAPTIAITDTKSDQTSKLSIAWNPIPPNVSAAVSVQANTALTISLRSKINPRFPNTTTSTPPPPSTPAPDHYFPKSTRNLAPIISLADKSSIHVAFEKINPSVGGVEASSSDTVAFWKAPSYKYTAPSALQTKQQQQQQQESISTEAFERFFPSKIRNRAPRIVMRKPKGDWDKTAFLMVGSEFVSLNTEIARQISVSAGEDEQDVRAAATVEKYFGGEFLNMAPRIVIQREQEKVEFSLEKVAQWTQEAAKILGSTGEGEEETRTTEE